MIIIGKKLIKYLASDGRTAHDFGSSVAMLGNTLAVGASGDDGAPNAPSVSIGSVYIYE